MPAARTRPCSAMTVAAALLLTALVASSATDEDKFPDLRIGGQFSTMSPTPAPLPHGFDGLFGGSLDVGLLEAAGPFDSVLGTRLRVRMGLGEGPVLYAPSLLPFVPTSSPVVARSFRVFYGADIVGAWRIGRFEPYASIGLGGATDEDLAYLTLSTARVGVSWLIGAGLSVDGFYAVDVGINHGDIMPGWMASSSSLGLGLSLSFSELFD